MFARQCADKVFFKAGDNTGRTAALPMNTIRGCRLGTHTHWCTTEEEKSAAPTNTRPSHSPMVARTPLIITKSQPLYQNNNDNPQLKMKWEMSHIRFPCNRGGSSSAKRSKADLLSFVLLTPFFKSQLLRLHHWVLRGCRNHDYSEEISSSA